MPVGHTRMKLPYRILVLDDDENALEGILELLRDVGYAATGAAMFEAAREMLASEPFDLLIADVRLRGFNGLHLVRQIRRDRPEMATMIMTGYDDTMMELESGRYGAAFVRKPIDPAAFLDTVAKSLAETRRARRWQRKQIVGGFRVTANGHPAAVLDVSYGGLRLEMPQFWRTAVALRRGHRRTRSAPRRGLGVVPTCRRRRRTALWRRAGVRLVAGGRDLAQHRRSAVGVTAHRYQLSAISSQLPASSFPRLVPVTSA